MINTEQIAEVLPTPRVTRLLERWRPTGHERTWSPNGGAERSVLLWQYFTGSEDESIALRRANGLGHILREIAIDIYDDELIVGEVGLEDVAQTRPDELSSARSYWEQRRAEFAHAVSKHESGQESGSYGLSTKWQIPQAIHQLGVSFSTVMPMHSHAGVRQCHTTVVRCWLRLMRVWWLIFQR